MFLRPPAHPTGHLTSHPRACTGLANKSLVIAGGFGVVLILVIIGLMLTRLADRGEPLPGAAYTETPGNFSGNRYTLDARIERQLGFREGVGRMILTRSTSDDRPIPLFAAASLDAFSPNPGQLYRFRVRVDGDGILNVESYEKR